MIKSTRKIEGFNSPKFPKLHGHVKLTLHNCKNGKEEVIEGDNTITNAVQDIMKLNMLGSVDCGKLFNPDGLWKKWFGGCICYEQQHANLNADEYFMPNSSDSAVTAHAGMTPIDIDHDDDPTQGQAVGSAIQRVENGIKLAWEWGQQKGNGYIRSLSLCHTDTGSFGNGVDSYHFKNTFTPWEAIQNADLTSILQGPRAAGNAFVQYDEFHTLFFYIGSDGWYDPSQAVTEQSEVTVYIRRFPYLKAGLFDLTTGTANEDDTRKFTVETSISFWYNPSFYFDEENKRLWLFTTDFTRIDEDHREWSRNTVYYSVIDCESEEEIDSGTIVSDDNDLAFLEISADGGVLHPMVYNTRVIQQNILKIEDDVYLPMGNSVTVPGQGYSTTQNFSGWKRINLQTLHQDSFTFADGETVLPKYYAAIKQGDIIAGFGWVMNGGQLYPCNLYPVPILPNLEYDYSNTYVSQIYDSPVFYMSERNRGESNSDYMPRFIFASKLLNTTKYNMDTVQKSSSQSMRVEYTITEEE